MALKEYANLALSADNVALVEVTSVRLRTESGQLSVDLLNEGLGGFSPGSGRCRLSVGFAVPIGGQEFPFQQACADGSYVAMQVPIGGDTYAGNGKIIDCEIGQSVNAATEGTFEWEGEIKPIE